MTATIIVGILFSIVILFGAIKSFKNIRNNTCPGCSGGCSAVQRSQCSKVREGTDGKAIQ